MFCLQNGSLSLMLNLFVDFAPCMLLLLLFAVCRMICLCKLLFFFVGKITCTSQVSSENWKEKRNTIWIKKNKLTHFNRILFIIFHFFSFADSFFCSFFYTFQMYVFGIFIFLSHSFHRSVRIYIIICF